MATRSRMTTVVAVAAGMMALGAGVGVAGLASADPTATPSASSTAQSSTGSGSDDRTDGHGGRHGERDTELAKTLADKLGVTEAKVTEALQAIREANRPTAKPSTGSAEPDRAARQAELVSQLADKLGIDEAKVKAAFDEIQTARQADRAAALKDDLDAAVKAGTLTQAEADAVTKAVQKGVINAGGHR